MHLDEYYSLKFQGAKQACDIFFKEKNIIPRAQTNVRPGEFEDSTLLRTEIPATKLRFRDEDLSALFSHHNVIEIHKCICCGVI